LDDSLFFNAGVRYDKYEIESGARDPKDLAKQKRDRFTPSFGISYLPLPWLKLRTTVSSSFKMPEPISQMNYSPGNTVYLANPDLRPESSVGWEFGADLSYEGVTVGATYFSIDYKDKIESAVLGTNLRQYQNLPGRTEYRGIEFNGSWDMGYTFDWDFNLKPYLSFTRMFRYFNTARQKKTGYAMDFNASYGVEFESEDLGLTASFDVIYYGHQLPHYTTTQILFGGDTVMNFHLSKDLIQLGDKGKMILKVDINNLNDNFYETMRNYPEEGRSYTVGLRYEF
jgi:outer membrane receptor protein involved in Fe transport